MSNPADFQNLMAQASDQQLQDVISRPADWPAEACEAARIEAAKRGVRIADNQPKAQERAPWRGAYEILPDGSKHFLRATAIDIILSLLVPGWGLVVGGYVMLGKDETKRGGTMMLIGAISLYADILYHNSAR